MVLRQTTGWFFEQIGVPLPGVAAILIATLETVGGIALMLGLLPRFIAIPLALDMAGAIFFVHAKNGFFVQNGGVELVLLLMAAAIGLALAGPGSWALDNRRSR